MTFNVGHDIGLDHLVHITVDVVCAIQHNKPIPAMTVYSTPNHHTTTASLIMFSNAGIGIKLSSVMPHPDPSITVGETTPGLICIKRCCSNLMACDSRQSVTQWSLAARCCLFRMGLLGTHCKSPEMITHGLCGYLGAMASWSFYISSFGWSPLIP